MPTTLAGPFPLIAGQQTSLPTPQGGGGAGTSFGIVIFNNSSFPVQVNGPGGTGLLQPNSADLFIGPGISQGAVSVTPQSNTLTTGTFVGTVQTIWGSSSDFPKTYPQPLVPFPGGASLIASLPSSLGKQPLPLTFAVPPGTAFVQLAQQGIYFDSLGGTGTIELQGVQTGTTYYSTAASGDPATELKAPLTISVISALDTEFKFVGVGTTGNQWFISAGLGLPALLYAIPGAVPAFATKTIVASSTGAWQAILGTPEVGAWYLFSATYSVEGAGGGDYLQLSATDAGTVFALIPTDAANGGNAEIIEWRDLQRLRLTSVWGKTGAAGYPIILNYAPGP